MKQFRTLALVVLTMSAAVLGCSSQDSSVPRAGSEFDTLAADGAWCWFADPRAVYDRTADKTYAGWVDSTAGTVVIASYDHRTGRQIKAPVESLHRDDHANPALLIRPDGRIMAFYSAHNGGTMYYRTTSRPHDISAWEPPRTLGVNTEGDNGYTYPNPIQLSAENDRIYLFWRGGNWQPNFSILDDGREWSSAQTLLRVSGERPYIKFASNGEDRIDFAFTDGHPHRIRENNVYYASYRDSAFYRADGTEITTIDQLPLDISRADQVYDAADRGARAWIWDTAIDSSGTPVIVFSTLPSATDHRYRYARWTSGEWRHYLITSAGGSIDGPSEPYYSGGVVLDHDDPSIVYLSREVDGTHELERWTTEDGGETWSHEAITRSSETENVRPVAVRGRAQGEFQVLWMQGTYEHYTDYQTALRAFP